MARLLGNSHDHDAVVGTLESDKTGSGSEGSGGIQTGPSLDLSTSFETDTTTNVRIVARGFSPGKVVFILCRKNGEINWVQWDSVITDGSGSIDQTRSVFAAPSTQAKVSYEVQVSQPGSHSMTPTKTFDV